MKICFTFEGIPHYYVHILDEINKEHDVSVILPKTNDFKKNSIKSSNKGEFKRFYLTKKKSYYGKNKFVGLIDNIKIIKPDLIIFCWPFLLQLIFYPSLLFYLKKNKIKIATKEIPFFVPAFNESISQFKNKAVQALQNEEILNNKFKYNFYKVIRTLLYGNIIKYTFNYISDGKRIFKSYGLKEENIFTTYNSHNTQDTFRAIEYVNRNSNPLKKRNRIIHIGRLVKWKRVDLLIEAVRELKNSIENIELLIIGNGPEKEALQKLVAELNVSDSVIFLGEIYDKNVIAKHLISSEVYVLAGMGGLSINEAMCHSLPIICSTCDGTEKDLVKEGVNGSFFDSDNLQSLCLAISKLLINSNLTGMGQKSLEIIKNTINENRVVVNYLEAFQKIKKDDY